MKSAVVAFVASLLSIGLVATQRLSAAAPATQPTQPAGKGSVSGTVAQDGKPLANVVVRLRHLPTAAEIEARKADRAAGKSAKQSGGNRQAALAETTTDDQGNFSFKDIAAGDYIVVARDRSAGVGGMRRVTVKGDQSSTVTIAAKEHKTGKKHKSK